ncbi:hypothetical protein GGR06_003702 [Bacteroides reticulotermitis]|uniref:Uncharacterized protein n=1 Tax=Bacteroides reticulotermitis TaxID=1133319 RepID=A0A840D4Z5_9BACE|nr:hypothetical protein [Bacteroides reticulotermitis]
MKQSFVVHGPSAANPPSHKRRQFTDIQQTISIKAIIKCSHYQNIALAQQPLASHPIITKKIYLNTLLTWKN